MTKQFGIIGYPLSHSFSPSYFNGKFERENIDAHYDIYPLSHIKEYCDLVLSHRFAGLNVTLPYKESIMSLLDEIDDQAKLIGAVNVINFQNGKTKGYNTDIFGFEKSLLQLIGSSENITKALVLGNGGAAKAVRYVLGKLGITYLTVSRSAGDITYEDIDKQVFTSCNLVINTTPLGMSHHFDAKPNIPYKWLDEKYFLYDLVYNPEKTIFLTEGLKKGCKIKNGYDMLILQAEQAWHIWNQTET